MHTAWWAVTVAKKLQTCKVLSDCDNDISMFCYKIGTMTYLVPDKLYSALEPRNCSSGSDCITGGTDCVQNLRVR
eukprot:1426518-Rhodomonas_salina.2